MGERPQRVLLLKKSSFLSALWFSVLFLPLWNGWGMVRKRTGQVPFKQALCWSMQAGICVKVMGKVNDLICFSACRALHVLQKEERKRYSFLGSVLPLNKVLSVILWALVQKVLHFLELWIWRAFTVATATDPIEAIRCRESFCFCKQVGYNKMPA